MKTTYYLTTTLPYVNAEPHIGMALELIQADIIARYQKNLLKKNVIFNFGTDEHGLKIYQKAQEAGKSPQAYCDEYAEKFRALKDALNLSYTNFIRTTDPHHITAAQTFWKLCQKNGDIYKKLYKIKYCVGCELEKTDSELVDGKCPLHPNQELHVYEEENYFFRFSRYQKKLLNLYTNNPTFILPDTKLNEIINFVKQELQDFSISRIKAKMPWGIDVPGDPDHVMYVWFDALINYISTIGWPQDLEKFNDYWPVVQFAGKDQVRQQAAMWQAMLLSAGLPHSKQIVIHGFLTVDGQKISKSLGNTIDPIAMAHQFGTDALRYYLLAKVHPHEDSDFSHEKFKETYNADLANGLGNLVARVARLSELKKFEAEPLQPFKLNSELEKSFETYNFNKGLEILWRYITEANQLINDKKLWELSNDDAAIVLKEAIDIIRFIAYHLQPFLPQTAENILEQFKGPKITSQKPLFPRI